MLFRSVGFAATVGLLWELGVRWTGVRQFIFPAPSDVWREGCWRFVVFPAVLASRPVDVVFAVHLAGRGAPVRVGMLDAGAGFASPLEAPRHDPLRISNPV